MHRRALILGLIGLAGAAASGVTWSAFAADMRRARARIGGRSQLMQSRFGALEYAVAGEGAPVLVVHGSGGGFDQGLDLGRRLSGAGWRVIAPSRFGYLRSAFPEHASSENQADAFADLLDELGVARAPILGVSAGALSAIQFAIRHPERCSALVAMVPAAYAPGRPAVRPPTPLAQALIAYGLRSDFLFWSAMKLNEQALIGSVLATDPALVAHDAGERARVREILHNILPVSARADGLANDGRLAGDPAEMALDAITAPTLAVSLDDDRYQTAAAARHIAASVPDAELIVYPRGGHVWVGLDETIWRDVGAFLMRARQ